MISTILLTGIHRGERSFSLSIYLLAEIFPGVPLRQGDHTSQCLLRSRFTGRDQQSLRHEQKGAPINLVSLLRSEIMCGLFVSWLYKKASFLTSAYLELQVALMVPFRNPPRRIPHPT